MSTPLRHFGTIRGGEEIVILGYNKGTNACLIARLHSLPQDESAQLRQIASSSTAQNLDFLVTLLRNEVHKSQTDWFTHLATRLHRNDGSVLSLPIKEIETMNEQQKAFFKGYGAPVEPDGGPSQRVGSDQEFRTPIAEGEEIVVAEPASPQAQAPANLEQAQAAGIAPTPATDAEMARAAAQAGGADPTAAMLQALTSLAESQAKQADAMAKMADKMKPAPRRTVRKKKVAAKTAEA